MDAANALSDFVASKEGHRLFSTRMSEFYSIHPEYKAVIQDCVHPPHKRGVASFCARHSTVLCYSKVDNCNVIRRTTDVSESTDFVLRLSTTLATMRTPGEDVVEALENALQQLRVSMDVSLTRLRKEVKERGICLKDGSEYGQRLPLLLMRSQKYRVRIDRAKQFPLAKMCLVRTH